MGKVFELTIKSHMEAVRSSSRQLSLQYMLNYPLGKKIKGKTFDEREESKMKLALRRYFSCRNSVGGLSPVVVVAVLC